MKDGGDGDMATTTKNPMSYFAEVIPKFSARDDSYPVTRWAQEIEDNAEIFGWSPTQRLLAARLSLVGTAALWLRAEKTFKTWEELKHAICKEFPDSLDSKAIHETMSGRKKRSDETCIDYMLTMKEFGKRGKMPDYVAIKYIVDGIQDVETNKIMLHGVTTYGDLKEKLRIYETIRDKVKATQRNVYKTEQAKKNQANTKLRCYSCGGKNHISADCPHKGQGRKCFNCNEFGHMAAACRRGSSSKAELAGSSSGIETNIKQSCFNSARGGSAVNNEQVGTTDARQEVDEDSKSKTSMGGTRVTTNKQDGSTCENWEVGDPVCIERRVLIGRGGKMADNGGVNGDDVNKQQVSKNILQQKPLKDVIINETHGKALIDSGSDVNLIADDYYEQLGAPECDKTKMITITGLGAARITSSGLLKCIVKIDGYDYENVSVYIVPRGCMPYKIILGHDFLKDVCMVMNEGSVWLKPSDESWLDVLSCFPCSSDMVGHITDAKLKEEIAECVDNYKPVQVKEAPIKLKFVLKDDVPVAQRPRRISLKEQEEVEQQISEWLDDGIIRVSYSEYASPLVLVRKKDGRLRVCVDYRQLNKKMIKDEFPMPVIEDYLDKLAEAKVFSVLDLKAGYFHLKVSEECVKYTSFVTHNGQYEFMRAPFGLSVCPKYFMRFVTVIFRELMAKGKVMIFVDDILIPARDESEAMERLREVLDIAKQYGLNINWDKAQLISRRVTYLGHTIEDGQVRPSGDKIGAVLKYPEPKTIKQLRSFVGLASYFRKYIQNFAVIASPLTDVLRGDNKFVGFDAVQREAFNMLKGILTTDPVLQIYKAGVPVELHTDASGIGLSAILMQRGINDDLHPVYYRSRRTTDGESKYTSYELEALAVIEGVKKFRHYLYGTRFKIVTDCKALQMTLDKKDMVLSAKVARWILLLQEYDYTIEHRQGTKMRHVDALSRNPYVALVDCLQDKIREAQQRDEGLRAIVEILREAPYGDYVIDNDILYKGIDKKLVIPRSLEDEIIKRVHQNGHFSMKKMLELINKDYYIRNVKKKVEEILVTCIPCLLASRKEGKQEGYLHVIEKEATPLHTLHIDHIGPMTDTKKQYNHILTMVDAFTKFVWLFPTKSTTSKEAIDKLRIHQQCFGNPCRIISDRGTAYTSAEFQQYCSEERIQHIKITTGVPRGNGQVERIHRIIISVLTKLCIEEPTQWYRHASRVQRALNSTYQRSVGTTPFEMMVGTKMKTKDDIELYKLLEIEEREHFIEEREEHRQQAKEQILKVQEENKRNYDRKRKDCRVYKVGEKVAIKRTQFGTGMKLRPKFLGPYYVRKAKGGDRYDVEKADGSVEGPNKTSTSADNMKVWPGSYDDE